MERATDTGHWVVTEFIGGLIAARILTIPIVQSNELAVNVSYSAAWHSKHDILLHTCLSCKWDVARLSTVDVK